MEDGRSGCWKRPLGRFMLPNNIISLLLVGLLCGLGFLALLLLGSGCLDDTDGNGLSHVTDSETSKRGEVNEGLDAHGLAGDQPHDAGVSGLDELGVFLSGLTCTPVNLLLDLCELAGNVGRVAIQDWRVAVHYLSRMVQHNDLGGEVRDTTGRLVLRVGGDISSLDILDGNVLDIEANVVSGHCLGQRLVVHLDGLDLS